MDLESLRNQIDAIDQEIIERINARVKLAGKIAHQKIEQGEPMYVPAREETVFRRLCDVNQGPLPETALKAIYRQIISATLSLEKKLVIAYLGPEATFTHMAAQKNFGDSLSYQPYHSIGDIFTAVEKGEADYGVVPIENSTEGAVFHSYDKLAETELKIVAQVYLEVSHCVLSHSPLDKIKTVISKDQAIGQCRNWIAQHLPKAELREADSTAAAVQYAAKHKGAAAIASKLASEIYEIPLLAEDVQDTTDNKTRFLVIGQMSSAKLGRKMDKSSYVVSLKDEPGALMRLLQPFSKRDINLTKIESRPSRKKAWDYYFFIDVCGHNDDPLVQEAIEEISSYCPFVKWLGSYPNNK